MTPSLRVTGWIFGALVLINCTSCHKKSEQTKVSVQSIEPQKVTLLLDIDKGTKIVLTIDGWHDYRPGDIVSAQSNGGGRDYEIVRGWFVVEPSPKNEGHWMPMYSRMYHVKSK